LAWALLAAVLTGAIIFLPQRAGTAYPFTSLVLWLAGLAGLIVSHRAHLAARWGRSIAAASLALAIVYWGALAVTHARALIRAQAVAQELATRNGETTVRVAATPVLANPLMWRCLAETDSSVHRFDIDLSEPVGSGSASNIMSFEKPRGEATQYVARAEKERRAEAFLGFARFPVTRVVHTCFQETYVQFADLRYAEPGSPGRGGFALEIPVAKNTDSSTP
jgi:hypothetical protein